MNQNGEEDELFEIIHEEEFLNEQLELNPPPNL